MRNIIKEIFNKEVNILKEDIERFIIETQLKESIYLEYKSTHKLQKKLTDRKGKDKKEKVLIKPLVAFLNKFSNEGGLLILGVFDEDGVPKKMEAAKKGIFASEHIRGWIHSNISSILPVKDFPQINIKEIDIGKESIFLIEIHPIDIHVVYFSKISNLVYIRKNDTSSTLSLLDAYRLVSEKICPKVFINIRKTEEKKPEEPYFIKIKLSYFNEGFKPGEWVRSTIEFKTLKGDPEKIKVSPFGGWFKRKDVINDPIGLFQSNTWSKEIIYPGVSMGVGEITINLEHEDDKLLLTIVTYEKEGKSSQTFLINLKEISSISREFNRYISI